MVSAEKTAVQLPPVATAAAAVAVAVAAGTEIFLHFEEVSKEEGSHRSLSTHEVVEGRSFDCEWLTGKLWYWRERKVMETVAADVVLWPWCVRNSELE